MKEIDGNFGGDVNKIRGVNFEGGMPVNENAQIYSAPHKTIDNLNDAHSALVGRSMVKRVQKAPKFDARIVAAVKGDLAELDANYATNKKSVHLEDIALERGVPYDKAMKIGEEFRKG